ncbi:MAG: NADP-dependent malic enzyme [Holosporales bacterium]|jgi:malate dehydrogenase (oxaloacetate-decarboxylating)(NADP+)
MTSNDTLYAAALEYHRRPMPGKLAVVSTKPMANQRDLALAYSPGVAAACEAIVQNPEEVSTVTARANLVAVISNGTAVLGLGDIGPLAAKPVMEGKAVLFKKFAGIDVFDIEINEKDPKKLIHIIRSLEPTFGGINLEDIKAPECFEVEEQCKQTMNIPVFHDDQHGTAIIVAAALLNGLKLVGKELSQVRLAVSGAGAAALACLDLLVSIGLPVENIFVSDIAGVVYKGRNELMDPRKDRYAKDTEARTLGEIIKDADVFLGLSAAGVLKPEFLASMAPQPIIFALANPTPEIMPDAARAVRPDAIIATGRSDFPNQVNNALCFPYIFRGALDVGAKTINEAMKIACVKALAALALAEPSDVVALAYAGSNLTFGREYLIPKPFDPRLLVKLAPAVARAAMESGVATRPIADFKAYEEKLNQFVFRSGLVMKPVFEKARLNPRRLVFTEGEEERVLRAVQAVVDEGIAQPILIGNPDIISATIKRAGLRLDPTQYRVVDMANNPNFEAHWRLYHQRMERQGVSPDYAQAVVRSRPTVVGALLLQNREADAMICGSIGRYHRHLAHIEHVLGRAPGAQCCAALSVLLLPRGTYFICDTYVNPNPSPEELSDMTAMATEQVQRFGMTPKVALLSHSSFGSFPTPSAQKMQAALALIRKNLPDLEVEGEMHPDAAISEALRKRQFPNSRLQGEANLLIMPTLDAANIGFNLLKELGDGLSIGPILLGAAMPAHIMTPSVTVRGILNMAALAVVDAQARAAKV